jgi:RNA polymerase sigma-70 factor (family 1)
VEHSFIWDGIKRGDKAALKMLHNRYFHQMCLYAARTLHNSNGLSEELVDDCFIKLWENRRKIEIHTSLKQYLFLMLHNAIIDHIRKKRLLTEPMSGDYSMPGDEKEFDDQKQYMTLYNALKKLPDQCRKVLELAIYDSKTYIEIAEELHISKNTVKTQMGRAYKHLKEMLDPKEFSLFIFAIKK